MSRLSIASLVISGIGVMASIAVLIFGTDGFFESESKPDSNGKMLVNYKVTTSGKWSTGLGIIGLGGLLFSTWIEMFQIVSQAKHLSDQHNAKHNDLLGLYADLKKEHDVKHKEILDKAVLREKIQDLNRLIPPHFERVAT
jgi:hypothetical protein